MYLDGCQANVLVSPVTGIWCTVLPVAVEDCVTGEPGEAREPGGKREGRKKDSQTELSVLRSSAHRETSRDLDGCLQYRYMDLDHRLRGTRRRTKSSASVWAICKGAMQSKSISWRQAAAQLERLIQPHHHSRKFPRHADVHPLARIPETDHRVRAASRYESVPSMITDQINTAFNFV